MIISNSKLSQISVFMIIFLPLLIDDLIGFKIYMYDVYMWSIFFLVGSVWKEILKNRPRFWGAAAGKNHQI